MSPTNVDTILVIPATFAKWSQVVQAVYTFIGAFEQLFSNDSFFCVMIVETKKVRINTFIIFWNFSAVQPTSV